MNRTFLNRTSLFTVTLAAAAWAQTAVSPPQIGWVEGAAQLARPVYGIAGNFMLGKVAPGTVVSFACSGRFQLIKTDSAVLTRGLSGQTVASISVSPGPALFSFFQDGTPGLAYLTSANELLQWSGGGFQPVTLGLVSLADSTVVSVASPDAAHAALIVQRGDGLWDLRVLLASGGVDSETPLTRVQASALMLPSGVIVYATTLVRGSSPDSRGIVIRRTDGSEIEFPSDLPAGFSLEQMGDGWVQLHGLGAGAQLAIRTTAGHEGVYKLPEIVE